MNDPAALTAEAVEAIAKARTEAELDAIALEYLGRKNGRISSLLSGIGKLAPEERAALGQSANEAKNAIEAGLAGRRAELQVERLADIVETEAIDITFPGAPLGRGHIHVLTQVRRQIETVLESLGYQVESGPEVETEWYNFEALNLSAGHPAREDWDSFYFNPNLLLRAHTSPVQIRAMLSQKPPIRVICPGRTYRRDSDQTHTPMFHQVEGLVIDRQAHLGHLKWILEEFCKAFFEVDHVKMRFRPSYFPFTEPSLEVDIQCRRDKDGIRFGEGEDWLEILGCGMVHPKVLKNCGIDPDAFQGFAWGMGIDRIAMLKYGMADLRAFFEADVRWLEHYGFKPLDFPTLAGGLST